MARNLDAVKKDLARRRSVHPRNQVKYRGFAGPIRTNQPNQLARMNAKAQIPDSSQAPELNGHILKL
jgi:hypothetical protein